MVQKAMLLSLPWCKKPKIIFASQRVNFSSSGTNPLRNRAFYRQGQIEPFYLLRLLAKNYFMAEVFHPETGLGRQ
jgi:hypothetical protein